MTVVSSPISSNCSLTIRWFPAPNESIATNAPMAMTTPDIVSEVRSFVRRRLPAPIVIRS